MERKTVGRALIAALLLFQCVQAGSDLSKSQNESMLWDDTPEMRMGMTSRATSTITEGSLASGLTVLIVLVAAASALKIKSLEKSVKDVGRRLA